MHAFLSGVNVGRAARSIAGLSGEAHVAKVSCASLRCDEIFDNAAGRVRLAQGASHDQRPMRGLRRCDAVVCCRQGSRGRSDQHHLFGAGRMVQHDPDGLRADDRHQDQHVAQGFGRGACAADCREGEPEDRPLVRRHRRSAPASGRARPHARVQVPEPVAAACVGAAASRAPGPTC
jgi:hypothetical protein